MPQSYTVGGDTLFRASHLIRVGQTFRVQTPFILEWIDLEVDLSSFIFEPVVLLYYADAFHHPYGDYISRNRYMIRPKEIVLTTKRTRFPMSPVKLLTDTYYCIVFESYPPIFELGHQVLYDAAGATYPRGIRISTIDGGATWTDHFDSDLIFCIFGSPPAPEPPPDPPVEHFAILNLSYVDTGSGLGVLIVSSVPCHMYLYWTKYKPDIHLHAYFERGLISKESAKYCFVGWHRNEQNEEGDTLFHTFIKEPWEVCETRYMTVRAKISGAWSPSCSPIFTKHRSSWQTSLIVYPDKHPELTSVDGYAGRVIADHTNNWNMIHDWSGNYSEDSLPDILSSIKCDALAFPDTWDWITRGILLFDLSALPVGATVTDATFTLRGKSKTQTLCPGGTLNVFGSIPEYNTKLIPADYGTLDTVPLATPITYPSFDAAGWNTFTFNTAGLTAIAAAILRDQILKIGLREATFDAPNVNPGWSPDGQIAFLVSSADGPEPPYLTLYYYA